MSNLYMKKDGGKSTKMDHEICDSGKEEHFANSDEVENDFGNTITKYQGKTKKLVGSELLNKSMNIVSSITDNSEENSEEKKKSTGGTAIEKTELVSESEVANIDSPLHASNLGMSFKQIHDVQDLLIRLYGPRAYREMTMRDVVELVVKPVCNESKKSYALYRNPKGLKASAFISHSWDEKFHTFVESIERVFETTTKKPNLWICAFAQFKGNAKDTEDQAGGNEQGLDQSLFVQALKAAEFFVVVRNSTTDLYTRIWCVCELILAMDYGMVPDKTFVTGPSIFESSTTSCLEADAWSQDDRDRILGYLTLNRSPEQVDEMIQAFRSKGAPSRLLKEKSYLEGYKWLLLFFVSIVVVNLMSLSIFLAKYEPQVSDAPTTSFAISMSPTTITSMSPTTINSMSPTTIKQGFIDMTRQIILENSKAADETIMNDESTQQYAAINWVATKMLDNGDRFSTKKTIQLYSLASICAKNNKLIKTSDECKWDGAVCDQDGDVIGLNLTNRMLTGTLPPEIDILSNLGYLALDSNQLSGSLPPELGNLGNLYFLSLNSNQLSGSIPSELGNLGYLGKLHIRRNKLSGSIPSELGNLGNLYFLSLSTNKLSGNTPSELGNLGNLETLSLGDNKLSGNTPSELGNLGKLGYLSLTLNQLSGSIPSELGNLGKLGYLSLSRNKLSGNTPSELGNSGNLETLYLYSNQLSGSIPSELGNLGNLYYLRLYSNQLSGSIPSELGNLGKLEDLPLEENKLSGSIPSELGNLGKLEDLSLSFNQLSGSIPSELGKLGNLYSLFLGWNKLSGSIPSELGNSGKLEHLSLTNNKLSGSIPSELGKLGNLYHLRLYSNQLSGSIPSELGNLGNLGTLYLDENKLSGSIPSELGNLGNLYYLHLYSNQLSGSIPSEFGNLGNRPDHLYLSRDHFYLENNQLSGSVPFSFCQRDFTPEIRVDCEEVICHCCVPACAQYTQPSSSRLAPTLPSNSKTPSSLPSPSPSTIPPKRQMPTQTTSPSEF